MKTIIKQNYSLPLDEIEVMQDELIYVTGGVMTAGAGAGCGCDCKGGAGCGCANGAGCGCDNGKGCGCGTGQGCGCGCQPTQAPTEA